MNVSRYLVTLTALNIAVLLLNVALQALPAFARKPTAMLRTRALEIVDDQGRVRASLNVLPASGSSSGAAQRETVLLRLITEQGRPSVKMSASEETSGLSVAGPTETKNAYAILEASATTGSLKLRAEDGREQTVGP